MFFDIPIQFPFLWAEHLYFRHIHCIVERKAVGGIILPADIWADICAVADTAGIYGSDGGVAGSTDCGVVYNGGGFGFSLSE